MSSRSLARSNSLTALWLIVSAIMFAGAGPAVAHPDMRHHCVNGEVCIFKGVEYTQGIKGWAGDDAWYGNDEFAFCNAPCNANDSASSVLNKGQQCGVRMFIDWFYGGDHFWLPMGAQIGQLNQQFNNALSSHDFCGDRGHH
jgi:hypothetical protein